MRLPDKAPDQIRYFLATPFMLLTTALSIISTLIMGERNSSWVTLKAMEARGLVEFLSEEEYEAKYGKSAREKPKENEEE
jgi:hypothetical protein